MLEESHQRVLDLPATNWNRSRLIAGRCHADVSLVLCWARAPASSLREGQDQQLLLETFIQRT